MQWTGVLIGLFSFAVIGLFHPIVIKCEYYFTDRVWPVFLVVGLVFLALSLWAQQVLLSSFFGVTGFTCLWSIGELRHQRERVRKGWFPQNPNRKEKKPRSVEEL